MFRVLDTPDASEYNGNYNGWSDLPNGGHIEAAVSSYHVDMTDRGDLNATILRVGFFIVTKGKMVTSPKTNMTMENHHY